MIDNNNLKNQALATLKGKWGSFVGLTFIYMLITGVAQSVSQIGTLLEGNQFSTLSLTLSIVGLVLAILIMPMAYGFAVAHLNSSRQDLPAEIEDLFCGYKRFGHVLGTLLLKGLIVAAVAIPCLIIFVLISFVVTAALRSSGMYDPTTFIFCLVIAGILLMIPIIVVSLMYAMVPYILRDKPEYSCSDVLSESRLMMKGHKGDLFWLILSFLGWILLGVLTLFIGYLWLIPYMQMTEFKFYEQIRAEYEGVADENTDQPVTEEPAPAVEEPAPVVEPAPETEESVEITE